jgi:hypothetical protein
MASDDVPPLPDEHAKLVEDAIASSELGRSWPMTEEQWAGLRRLAADVSGDDDTGKG